MDVVEPTRTFRYLLRKFRYSVKDNWWHRRFAALVSKWYCLLTCETDRITAEVDVTDEVTLVRYPDLFAKRTEILNTGDSQVFLFENSVIVGIVQPGTSRAITLTNRYILDAVCRDGESTTVVVTTTRRCECGDTDPLPYGQVIDPIGGDLI